LGATNTHVIEYLLTYPTQTKLQVKAWIDTDKMQPLKRESGFGMGLIEEVITSFEPNPEIPDSAFANQVPTLSSAQGKPTGPDSTPETIHPSQGKTDLPNNAAARDVTAVFDRLSKAENHTFSLKTRIGHEEVEQGLSGRTERGGWTCLRLKEGGHWHEFVFHGKRGVVAAGAEWVTLEELESKEFRAKMPAGLSDKLGYGALGILRAWKSPHEEALAMAAMVTAFRNEGNRRMGEVKADMLTRMYGPGPTSCTFWVEIDKGLPIKWGALGTTAAGPENKITFEWTVEITAIGTTDMKVPPAARKRLEAADQASP
jgi:hypothetical protein